MEMLIDADFLGESIQCTFPQDELIHTGSEEDHNTVLGTEEIQHKRMEERDTVYA